MSLLIENVIFLLCISITCFVQTPHFSFFIGLATMKENKEKGLANKETM